MRYLFECMLITLNVISACEHVIDITSFKRYFFMNEVLLIAEKRERENPDYTI